MAFYDFYKKYIDKLLTIKKNDYEFLRDKAFIEYLDNDYLISEKYIKKALHLNSEEVFGLNILGLLYIKKDEILEAVINRIPAPVGDEEAPLQAMIFDSVFNSFRGIIQQTTTIR
mgnify:CR=1 FL=1